jgi:copper chaperone CopZ
MTWASWPLLVEKALVGLPGVKRAEVSFTTKQAVVTYDAAKVQVEQMMAAVTRVGFSAALHQ